jgi:hypothetical protein
MAAPSLLSYVPGPLLSGSTHLPLRLGQTVDVAGKDLAVIETEESCDIGGRP